MTKQEREYLVLRIAQDLAKLLRKERGQQAAWYALVTATLPAVTQYVNKYVLSE